MEVIKIIKLDYSLKSPEERNQLVQQYLEENPDVNEAYLEVLADYLVLPMEKQEKKEKQILTDNRLYTVNQRETSFEGLVSQLENGEDGIYNLITENSKNSLFKPKISITKKDLAEVPFLAQLRETIDAWDQRLKMTEGKPAYIIKRALIEMRKDQYLIKAAYRRPITLQQKTRSKAPVTLDLDLTNPKVVSAILCNYSRLKQDSWDRFQDDTWYLMIDFDKISEEALKDYPIYERIVEMKIDGATNPQIQEAIKEEFGVTHTPEHISSLWRNKIPKIIASLAEDQELDWHYLAEERGQYKTCGRCGKIKLALPKYFSKNKTSKDGLYSICKECRRVKK